VYFEVAAKGLYGLVGDCGSFPDKKFAVTLTKGKGEDGMHPLAFLRIKPIHHP